MQKIISGIILMFIFLLGPFLSTVNAEDKKPLPVFENEQLKLQLFPRSTEQMAGFFEARGFPAAMTEKLSAYCFFTAVIKNKMNDNLWLDLREWDFSTQQKHLSRMPRSKWPPLWKNMKIPLAAQSTFRWTLLPEILNFYAHETEGGNIVLQKTNTPFELRARFGVGEKKDMLVATVKNLLCADAKVARQ